MEDANAEMNLPRVLIVSPKIENAMEIANNMKAKHLLKQGDTEQYLLDIDNKYYTAKVLLCATQNLMIDTSDFEALLFHYDFETGDLISIEKQISLLLAQSDIEILLLLSNSISNITAREKVIEWCATKKFELVELNLTEQEIMDLEEDQSNYGIARIIEVLETHTWPNMNLKDNRKNVPVPQSEVRTVEDQLENVQLNSSQDFSERLQVESILDGIMNNEDADFGELFCHLKAMKEQAAQMPSNQRRVAAEQLVTAFWKAIGGDPSEIDDSDEDCNADQLS